MATTKIIKHGQTVIDIAVEHLGDADRFTEICDINGLDYTADLTAGNEILIPEINRDKKNVAFVFLKKNMHPASAIQQPTTVQLEGIGYWVIEDDFVVQ